MVSFGIKLLKALTIIIFICLSVFIAGKVVDILYPLKYLEHIKESSQKYDLDMALVCSLINAESRFRPMAKSHKGASGLMQLMETTASWGAEEIELQNYSYDRIFEPALNIELGCWYLNKLLNQYNNDYTLVLAAYNAGSGNVAKWLEDERYSRNGTTLTHIPFEETRSYIEKIEGYMKVYSILLKWRN